MHRNKWSTSPSAYPNLAQWVGLWQSRYADRSDASGGVHPRRRITHFCKYGMTSGLHKTFISNGWVLIVAHFVHGIEN